MNEICNLKTPRGGVKRNLHCKNNNDFKAFTLAEVLITLVIIGIVVAITVPIIIANANAEAKLEKIKKSYSAFSQGIMRSRIDNGPIDEWYEMADKNADKYYSMFFKPYFNVLKTCRDYQSCGYNTVTPWKYLDGSTFEWWISNDISRFFFYLGDGQFAAIKTGGYGDCLKYDDNGKCLQSGLKYDTEPSIIIDVNGPKPPNIIGKDVFLMQFSEEKGVLPYCYTYTDEQVKANCTKNSSGMCCLKMLMGNGWIFPEKYPK